MPNGPPTPRRPRGTQRDAIATTANSTLATSPLRSLKTPRQAAPPRINKEQARAAILDAWPGWMKRNLPDRKATDNDAHAFLRSLRLASPELFSFKSSTSPHETAFSWLLAGGCIAY